MIWIALGVLVIGYAFWKGGSGHYGPPSWVCLRQEPNEWDWEDSLFYAFFTSVPVIIVVAVLAFLVGSMAYDVEPKEPYEIQVVAAKDGGSLVQGGFSIFAGYVDERPQYVYYYKTDDGGVAQNHVETEDTVIYEDQESRSYIVVHKTREGLDFFGVRPWRAVQYEIHVPAGSVKKEVEFDLE